MFASILSSMRERIVSRKLQYKILSIILQNNFLLQLICTNFFRRHNVFYYSRTSIIRISWLSGLLLWSQFGQEYLLVMIEILSHHLFKTTALKSEVEASLFRFEKAKAALARVVTNEEHSNEVWLAYINILDYPDPRLSRLYRPVPTSPDNRGSNLFDMFKKGRGK